MAGLLQSAKVLIQVLIIQFALCAVYLLSRVHQSRDRSSKAMEQAIVSEVSPALPDKFSIACNYTRYTADRLKLTELQGIAPIEPELGPVFNDVASFEYVVNNDVCDRFGEQVNRTLLVVVVSAAANADKRRMIRQTWAQTLSRSNHFGARWARYVFLVASGDVSDESREYADIIQVKLEEAYSKLTSKSVALLSWVTRFCPHVQLILKCDDDIFVNVQQLVSLMGRMTSLRNLYGSGVKDGRPHREPGSKYYISREEWPWSTYPAFLFGGAYFIGRDAVRHLLAAAQTTPFFKLEDVYVTGVCAVKANVSVFISQKMYRRFISKTLDACFIRQTTMWQTQTALQFLQSDNSTREIYSQGIQCKVTEYTLIG